VSGIDRNVSLHGLPYGGCAFLYKKGLTCKITEVSTGSRCGVVIVDLLNSIKFLNLTVFLPRDSHHDQTNLKTDIEVLRTLKYICNGAIDGVHVIIGE